jgi:hypothetical protein
LAPDSTAGHQPSPPTTSIPPRHSTLPHRAIPVDPPANAHPMRTRAKSGYFMPQKLFDLSATTAPSNISPIPSSYR